MILDNLIEKRTTINGTNCYGTNNIAIIKLLIREGHIPITTNIQNGVRLHYFERTEQLDEEIEFYKCMLSGGIFEWMAQMTEKYGGDQMFYDLL